MDSLDTIADNARTGDGPCVGCDARETGGCKFVNPGLLNPRGRLLFVTDEPSHAPNWDKHDSWESYNSYWGNRFKQLRGGRFITRLLQPVSLSLDDVWVTDSIKCPTTAHKERGIPSANTADAFAHCRRYLEEEIDLVDPEAIICLGKSASIRTLQALGVPETQTNRIRVTKDYGRAEFDTDYPVIISLHWAQRTTRESEWVPVVQNSIKEVMVKR